MKNKVAIYCRVSTQMQSTDRQKEELLTFAKEKPYYFVMCDSSMATDNVADNFDQIFNAYSKDTIRRIL